MIYLSIGSNLNSKFGNRFENITKAVSLLKNKKIKIKKISNFFETPSYPNKKNPKFINIIIEIEYSLKPEHLLKEIFMVERKMDRKRNLKNAPRTCDIDIIDFNGKSISMKFGQQIIHLPHSNMHKRNFVLMPMLEISHHWVHPKFKKNIVKLLLELPNDELNQIKFA